MTLDRWDDTAKVSYDRAVWNELCSLRLVDCGHNAVIMGPVGVGKTFLATALGHAAVRRRFTVHFERCDRLLKRLRASRGENSQPCVLSAAKSRCRLSGNSQLPSSSCSR